MQTLRLETHIAAPPERCFLLSLSIDLHMSSTAPTRERAIAGVTHGLIGAGETVTWEGTHFGIRLRHTSLIVEYEPYHHFCDEMTEGTFKTFRHDHFFESIAESTTLMRDELRFSAPFSVLGRLAERFVLREYMRKFLLERNQIIKRVAESQEWRRYLS